MISASLRLRPADAVSASSGSDYPRYGRERLVALPRDPRWLWLYWELKSEDARGEASIRLYDAATGRLALEVPCDPRARGLYLQAPHPGRSYYAEIGRRRPGGSFKPLLRSNPATLPFGSPTDEKQK